LWGSLLVALLFRTLEHWYFEFVSDFGLPRRDLIGSCWISTPASVTVQVKLSCTPGLGRGFRASDLSKANGLFWDDFL